MTTFQAPPAPSAGGDKFAFDDHKGNLLLITVHEYKEGISTSHGVANAVAADIAVLDGPDKGGEYRDVLIFPKVIVNQLKGQIGATILARLGQGEKQPGKSAPWVLNAGTADDQETAAKYVAWKAKQAIEDEQPF